MSKQRIFIIDDEQDDLQALEVTLRAVLNQLDLDMDIVGFDSSNEAVKAIAEETEGIALIVSDVYLPDKDANEILSFLAQQDIRIPVVLVSGVNPTMMGMVKELGLAIGANVVDAFAKPVSQDDFLETASKIFE